MVLVVALIVLGPSRLPDAAKSLGKAVAEFRRMSSGLQAEVRDAFSESAPTPPAPPYPAASSPPEPLPPAALPAVALPTRPEDAELAPAASAEDEDPPAGLG